MIMHGLFIAVSTCMVLVVRRAWPDIKRLQDPVTLLEQLSLVGSADDRQSKVGFLRIVGRNDRRFLGSTCTAFGIQTDSNRALAAGRDCPVKTDN